MVATIIDENGNKGKMWFNELSDLPPGQYEIIGLYSEACIDWAMLLRVAVTGDVDTKDSLNDFLQKNDVPIPTDTTDLLFIHKLK